MKTRVASHSVRVMMLTVEDEGIGRAADFGALLGRIGRFRRRRSRRRHGSLVGLTVRAGRHHVDVDCVSQSVVLDLNLRIAESAGR